MCAYNHTMKRIHLFIDTLALKALEKLSEKTGANISEHIRRAISAYLKKEAK